MRSCGSVGLVSLYKSNGIDQDNRADKNKNSWNPSLQLAVEYGGGINNQVQHPSSKVLPWECTTNN